MISWWWGIYSDNISFFVFYHLILSSVSLQGLHMHNKAIGFMVINPCKLSNTSLSYNSSHYIHRSYLCLSRTANFAGSSVFCDLLLEGLGVFFCAFNLHFHRKLSEINCKCTYSTAFLIHIIIHNCIWYFFRLLYGMIWINN